MTTSPRSLIDWIGDQLAEVRHASPLAVLAPTKPAPVAVPDLADMPSTDTEPCCERKLFSGGRHGCDAPAAWSVGLRHLLHVEACAPVSVLMCDSCHDKVAAASEDLASLLSICVKCRAIIACRHDLITSEVRL